MTKIVRVTDHALLRYLERVLEMDVEELRRKLEAEALPGAVAGAKSYRVGDVVYVMEHGIDVRYATVATVILNDMREGMYGRAQFRKDQKKDRQRRMDRRSA